MSKGLQPPQAEKAARVLLGFAVKMHRGPLPPAEELGAYDAICPGAAKEILDMAIRQQTHTHFCEKAEISAEIKYRSFGMIAAVSVVLILVCETVACAYLGQTSVAIILGSVTAITSLAGAFIRGRVLFQSRQQEKPAINQSTKVRPVPKGKR